MKLIPDKGQSITIVDKDDYSNKAESLFNETT